MSNSFSGKRLGSVDAFKVQSKLKRGKIRSTSMLNNSKDLEGKESGLRKQTMSLSLVVRLQNKLKQQKFNKSWPTKTTTVNL